MSGELMSALMAGKLRCWVLQEGIRGAETGVRPVPPTINESKLNWMPVDGVLMLIPASSETFLGPKQGGTVDTFKELGRLGLAMGTAELSMIFFAGVGREKMSASTSRIWSSIISVLIRSADLLLN